jgi:inner membrane protein
MSGTNHVVGGTVFTGIFASFWNVNIFAEPSFLFFTVFFAILPDIDHVKSPIGKLFYPIAKWLNIKYGHRTVTHSAIFFFCLLLIVAFIEKIFRTDFTISLIVGFAYFSHLLFDMMTKAGIPLFWPFKKNPCVIPGNPELRLKSSDFQTEAMVFGIFILLGITCQNLFAQGFWTTYNKVFNDIKHLHQEATMNENVLIVEYSFKKGTTGKEFFGKGLLVKSNQNEATIFNNGFIHITNDDKIATLQHSKTNLYIDSNDLLFYNISPDSLTSLVKDKAIINLKIQSSQPFEYVKENLTAISKTANFDNVYNPTFTFHDDSTATQLQRKIELLNYELQKTLHEKHIYEQSRRELHTRIDSLTISIDKMDFYEREKATKELNDLKNKSRSQLEKNFDTEKLKIQLSHLQKEINSKNITLVSGYIQFIEFK